jgi:hypothetical protein
MWLVGAWVLPRTSEAYLRRVTRIWCEWVSQTQSYSLEGARKRAEFVQSLRGLRPPDELRGQHERLVSLIEERDRLSHERPRTPTLMSEMTMAQRAARESREQLIAVLTLPAHQPYAVALDRLFSIARKHDAETAARAEAATETALRAVEHMTPPSTVDTEHALLTAALREHLEVERRFRAATRAGDPKGVAAATAEWERSAESLRDRVSRVCDQAGARQR